MKRHDDTGDGYPVKRPASAFTEQIRWMVRQVVQRFKRESPPPPDDTPHSMVEAG